MPPGADRPEVLPITLAQSEQAVASAAVRYDRTGDQHYDVFVQSFSREAVWQRRRKLLSNVCQRQNEYQQQF